MYVRGGKCQNFQSGFWGWFGGWGGFVLWCLRDRVRELHDYLPRVSFSPESGGNVKPSRAIDEIKTHGTIKLKK